MIRTAIFGLGKVAEQIHIPACQTVEEIQLVAGCDPAGNRREAMQARFRLPAVYAGAQELLEKEQPELVIIGTPPDSHKDLCLLALEQGAHVLCEKPFMPSVADADEVIAAAARNRRLLAVNNQYRYMNTYRQAQERLARGDFGRLFFLHCWQQMFHPPALEPAPWRSALKRSTLFEFGTHALDLITFFFDALPVAVGAAIPRARPEYDADVLVHLTLYFPDERLATMTLNRVSHAPERYLEMRLDCEKASLRLSLGGVGRASFGLTRYHGRSRPQARFSFVKGGEARAEVGWRSSLLAAEPRPAFASATAAHLRHLLPEMQQPIPSLDHARHAREVLRLVFAGYEAAEKQAIITSDEQ
ncbi:MAG: Gfo/Idh/MocA family oxidoreductase [Chloroflexi bacterium]|nr:Gfo/Idh/MocA family oxidoreductase [Chloroflexota bacterium]MCI0579116.1 Gfo/Idh/MocA family oxidoreductase [Chloroflexota bacterium]MCI0643333.1 Gfo/Idh/MocA family oxidoreductase [Chloroflexota bacterium]MCI0728312.1 Gfo/Idh/MocA family oxidoreductase [Chloroflexota bacterium]